MIGTDAPSKPAGNEGMRYAYPDPRGYLMVFGGPMAHESKRWQKLIAREVNAAT
jgi:hypothetical protein